MPLSDNALTEDVEALTERLEMVEHCLCDRFPNGRAVIDMSRGRAGRTQLMFGRLRAGGGLGLHYIDIRGRSMSLTKAASIEVRTQAVEKLDELYEALCNEKTREEIAQQSVVSASAKVEAFLAKHDYLPPYMATRGK